VSEIKNYPRIPVRLKSWEEWLRRGSAAINYLLLHLGSTSDDLDDHTPTNPPTPPTTSDNWNAHGNDGVGGGGFSLDNNLDMPLTFSYQINGEDMVARNTDLEFTIGPNNNNFPGNIAANPNIIMGYGCSSFSGSRHSLNVGLDNQVLWRNSVGVGIDLLVSNVVGGKNAVFGYECTGDDGSAVSGVGCSSFGGVSNGIDSTTNAQTSVASGINCVSDGAFVYTSGVNCSATALNNSMAFGINCEANGQNVGSIGIGVRNSVGNTLKIGPNNSTAIVVAGNGLGVAIDDPQARLHLGPPSPTTPAIIMETSAFGPINSPIAGAIEYSAQPVFGLNIASSTVGAPALLTTASPHGVTTSGVAQFTTVPGGTFSPQILGNQSISFTVTGPSTITLDAYECTVAGVGGVMNYTNGDHYIWFTHADLERSQVVTNRTIEIDGSVNPYIALVEDSNILVDTSTAVAAVTVQLPMAASAINRVMNVSLQNDPGNPPLQNVIIQPILGETINFVASATILVAAAGTSLQITSTGTRWAII